MSFNFFTFARKINRPLLLDGAMGSLLQQNGIKSEGRFWTSLANIKNPELVSEIYKSYIKAGADIITTNTFRTNPAAVNSQSRIGFKELNKAAVLLAKESSNGHNVMIAGSNAPAEDCYQIERKISKKKLELNHKQHIDELMKNGCDFVLNETQSHFDEIKIICDHCYRKNIPYIVSLLVNENNAMLSGQSLTEIIKFVRDKNPLAIGFNCIQPNVFLKISNEVKFDFNWGMYLNLGAGKYSDKRLTTKLSPNDYSSFVSKFLTKKPSFIGTCCGSNPNHIKKLREMLNGKFNN